MNNTDKLIGSLDSEELAIVTMFNNGEIIND